MTKHSLGVENDMEFSRVIGRRKTLGVTPGTISNDTIKWMDSMNQYKTRVPKGVFRYKSHEEANIDMDYWLSLTLSK